METRKKLLIVEDDQETIKFYNLFFRKYFEVDVCPNGTNFFEHLNSKDYDCIIIDIALTEEITGLDITAKVKSNPKYSHIPIICVTAHIKQIDRQNAFNAGVDLFVAKPVPPHELLAKINLLIEEKKG
ncbi:MAG: response regulator [Bacteroidota bacterium]